MLKQLFIIFLAAFFLNLIWEHAHHILYIHYQGSAITNYILFRAAGFDALLITAFSLPFVYIPTLRKHLWLFILFLVLWAVGLELFALETGRWAYKEIMPIIPVLGTGVTPTIQLGLLGYISFKLSERYTRINIKKPA